MLRCVGDGLGSGFGSVFAGARGAMDDGVEGELADGAVAFALGEVLSTWDQRERHLRQ
jgi:outer membrane lipoprotein SlyB